MSKHSKRQYKARKARRIDAKSSAPEVIAFDAELAINAASGDEQKGPRRFEMLAYNGGTLQVGGYPLPVVVDLAGMEFRTPKLPTYYGHHDGSDGSKLVGHSDSHSTEGGRLVVSGVVSAATAHAKEVVDAHDNGYQWQASVGVQPRRDQLQEIKAGKTVTVNGQTFVGPIIVARKSTLRHIAILPEGADSGTSLSIAANAAQDKEFVMDPKFEEWIEAMFEGDVPELTDKQKATLLARYEKEQEDAKMIKAKEGEPKNKVEEISKVEEIVKVHAKYMAAIEAKAGEFEKKADASDLQQIQADAKVECATLKAQALDEEKPIAWLEVGLVKVQAKATAEMIKAEFKKAPAIHGSTRDVDSGIIEAALCGAAGLRGIEKAYSEETLEAAHAYRRNQGASLNQMLLACAVENGYTGDSHRIHRGNYDAVMRTALIQASSPSTHTLTTMLSTVGNKFLLEGFNTVEQVWREFADIRTVNDFKAITSYRMLDDMVFEEVGAAGEIKHGTAKQESYSNQAKTYAKMFALTRQDIINDDLGAFNNIRDRIGRGSGIKLNQVFWTSFLDDATLFNATAEADGGHNNLLTTALGESGMTAAEVLLDSKTDGHGNPIDIGGEHILLTGSTLHGTARKWYVSEEIRDTTASTKTPTTNIYKNRYRPVKSRYVTSTTAWYLLPMSGGDMAPMEVCFLDGVQAPTIESADADFNTLGVQFRGYFDFGVAQKEWRASVKSTGAG
jgi:hypothetical protein